MSALIEGLMWFVPFAAIAALFVTMDENARRRRRALRARRRHARLLDEAWRERTWR